MPKTDIIIPTFGQEGFTSACFDSISQHTKDYRLLWVDNGSSKESRDLVMPSFEKSSNRLPIWSENNLGFVEGVNLGLKMSTSVFDTKAKYIVIQNNDTVVTKDWLSDMIAAMDTDPRIAVAGPMTSTRGSWQGWQHAFKRLDVPPFAGMGARPPEEIQKTLKGAFRTRAVDVKMVAFFCTVFRRSVFEELGFLDTRFGAGLGDDDDFCKRVTDAGYKIAFVPGVYVVHNHRTTFKSVYSKEKIRKMQLENTQKLKQKHGNLT
jgi:GT2 family glycosyltransferase